MQLEAFQDLRTYKRVSADLDKLLRPLRDEYIRMQTAPDKEKKWKGKLVWRSIIGGILKFKAPINEKKDALLAKLTFVLNGLTGTLAGIGIHFIPGDAASTALKIYFSIGLPLIGILYSYINYSSRFISPGDPFFNINAYQNKRPIEYNTFLTYITNSGFTHQEFYEKLERDYLLVEQGRIMTSKETLNMTERLVEKTIALETDNEKLQNRIQEIVAALDGSLTRNEILTKCFLWSLGFLEGTLSPVSLDLGDLRFLGSGYSLYKLAGDRKFLLDSKSGIGEAPEIVDLYDRSFAGTSMIRLFKDSKNNIVSPIRDRPACYDAAYRVRIQGHWWIFNLHVEDDRIHDIIRTRDFSRLIEALLKHLFQMNYLPARKGVDDHAEV
ncbi:hypothetical protein [Cohnella sp. AR92]|uniref:hypothetical protein n=1 Tax=Cohnella sp. AR92 TaxID=648716 RepID=UPI000F8D7CA2|nr:hypothetical protein [Cohnella sp. AR92]RUS48595.1 hypothetical protein ELR57_04065 [Cohnella sp. AR92]